MVVSSRERILDVAMELFGQQGFKATSVTQIETAAGLSPGSGGIYHYFRNKQALLEAGIARHLDRLDALRDIQAILVDLGDLRAELTVLGRYALTVLDRETDLLRIVLTEARARPELVGAAADQLVAASYTGFAGWLQHRGGLSAEDADRVAAVGLGALFSTRLFRLLLDRDPLPVTDDEFLATWVDMLHTRITR